MAKRRHISLLPAFNQTDDLKNFFGTTVDQVFQPGTSEQISGYIGRRPEDVDPHDFYVGEPTESRTAYQLESGMVSYDPTGLLTTALSYPDFLGYLGVNGANTTEQQRMFETDYYAWAPPLNIDMVLNYRNYYWFGDIDGAADLPILILTVPVTTATGDGVTTTYPLPASIVAVGAADETPTVYVNRIPAAFTVVGTNVVLTTPPAMGAYVLVARVPDWASVVAGRVTIDVSDLNSEGVQWLSSGMRIKVIDALYLIGGWDLLPWDTTGWDFSPGGHYMVDGIGQSVRFTSDSDLIRGVEAQYVTIDRSSLDTNIWSLHNLWVHRDTFAWADTSNFNTPLSKRQATRPIIEFLRDIVLWQDAAILASPATVGTTSLSFTRSLPDLRGRLVIGSNISIGTSVTDGHNDSLTLSSPVVTTLPAGTVITFRQDWSESTDPMFMLYDLNEIALNDPTRYPGSNFNGNRIFGYSQGTLYDPVLRRSIALDSNDYIVFQNDAVVNGCSYDGGLITSLAAYATDDGSREVRALWHAIPTTTIQGVTDGFYDVPVNLQANPSSDDVTTISRSTWTEHFTAIVAGQINLIGNPHGANNFRDTARDLTFGRSILQHRAPLLKAMLLATNPAFDLLLAIRYADQEYNRFRNKFARKLVDLRTRGVLLDTDPATVWVTTALAAIKRDKNNQFPFALNTIGGSQYFIPPTPTCLGVLPAAIPAMVTDTTYASPVLMILGHDGSFTPAFSDWRDPIMLALEQMIYGSLPIAFKSEARPVFDLPQWMGTRFYDPFEGYTSNEVSIILRPMFELWAQQNHFDYRTNTGYNPNDPFTWNYRGVRDRFNQPLPGNWRAIYRLYYGTDAPHLRPWECLGFISEPLWWQGVYGTAPYTRSNTALWGDLEAGTIVMGLRSGTDPVYARPGLSDVLPVDAAGDLLDPVAIGIVITNITRDTASRLWLPGDQGPVENLWWNSPSYRFALAQASFLMKPARFVEQCWDVLKIGYVGSQWVTLASLARPLNADVRVHGEQDLTVIGLSQWIADYLRAAGHASDGFGSLIRGLSVRLIHQMAGFVSRDDLKIVAENFGLVPAEDVTTLFYRAPNTRSEVYSGVILEWTGHSWRAIGYDARNPYFTIIPPDPNGPKGLISLASSEPNIVKWHANTYFAAGVLVEYLNSVWQAERGHTSGPRFEQMFWSPRSDIDPAMARAPRVVTYRRGLDATQQIEYGTDLYSIQQVGDFLLGWQRWLESRGWVFDTTDETGQLLDWSLAVKEFLSWTQVQWSPGNFIALSPGQQQLKFTTATGTILNVENSTNAFFGLSNRSGQPIGSRDALISRLDGNLSIHANNADIFAARLAFADVEHALVLSNTTIFDDNIYLPLYNQRQTRLRLICKRARDWSGRLDAPGFVVIADQLKSDYDKAAEDVRLMFDIELADRVDLRDYARHVINFQKRDYMENLLLADVEQFEFFQGSIQQKGAPGVFHKLARSNRATNNSDLRFLEEWAIRIGEFGAPVDPFMTFDLTQTDMRNDPQLICMVPTANAPLDWIVFADDDPRWLDEPSDPSQFFTMRTAYGTPTLPTAGPVRLSDVSNAAFHLTDLPDLFVVLQQSGVIPFPTGSSTWVYERDDGTYTVLRGFETGTLPNAILTVTTATEDVTVTTTRIYFQNPITLTTADIGNYLVVDGLSLTVPDLQGLSTITDVNPGGNYVEIATIGIVGYDFTASSDEPPLVRVLREVRFATQAAIPAYAFASGDLVWIDNDLTGRWTVLQWSGTTWTVARVQPLRPDPSTIAETVIYRTGTQIIHREMFIDQPIVDELGVIDPLSNLIAGIADREIDYKTPYDPARYNAGNASAANAWGAGEVGRVWWNLATVKFLDPFTDTLGQSNQRDLTELAYRTEAWTHIAPNTTVDVYEWTQSTVAPSFYAGPGTVFNNDDPTWAEHVMFDAMLGRDVTLYFYWVRDIDVTPTVSFRHTDVSTVAQAIENPSGLDLSWMAPLDRAALIVSGVSQFLNDTDTVMKVRIATDPDSPGRHDQWELLRPGDDTSLPSAQIWQTLQASLAGFDVWQRPIPDPTLNPLRAIGVRQSQGMFNLDGPAGPGTGLLAARESFVGIINNIFEREPFVRDRLAMTGTLFRSTPIDAYLVWAQLDISYVFEPPPRNEWDIQVYALDQRNRLLARDDFLDAVTDNTKLRVLINSFANPLKQWSIWEFDPAVANTLIIGNPTIPVDELLVSHADEVFHLAPAYEFTVADLPARNALLVNTGDRVLVTGDFWAIWKYLPNDPTADGAGFVLWRVQNYRTDDFVARVDWYMTGYSASNPPITSYTDVTHRNAVEGTSPINEFVKLDDDDSGHWIWTQFNPDIQTWSTVAAETGTLALSTTFFAAGHPVHGAYVWHTASTATSAGQSVLTFADTTGIEVGQFVVATGFDRATKVATVTNTGVTLDTPTLATIEVGDAIAFTTLSVTDVTQRDGSWEIDVLAASLRYAALLTDAEVNEIFFSMLNFVHVQNDSVDWAFKTSFMSIVGYNVPLQQTSVLLSDQTPSLLSYVNEVKPYHVKVRSFSTHYNTDVDQVSYQATEDNAFDITLLFDRSVATGWDIPTWDTDRWDAAEPTSVLNQTYVHTVVLTTLASNGPQIAVDDVRSLGSIYVNDVLTDVSPTHPLTISINDNLYMIGTVTADTDNRSTTLHGISGTLTTVSGNIVVADGTAGNLVEAIIPMVKATVRISDHYHPGAGSPPNDLNVLFGFGMRPSYANYILAVDAPLGATTLTLTDTTGVVLDQPVVGPNIVKGTVVTNVTDTTVDLSLPITNAILYPATIMIALPIEIAGTDLVPSVPAYAYDGGVNPTTVAGQINPTHPRWFGLRDPYENGQPEERVPVASDEALHVTVTALPEAGGPPQTIKAFDVSAVTAPTVTLFFDVIPQSAQAVLVYRDGVRATLGTDYTIDYFARTATVTKPGGLQRVIIHVFGFAGISVIDNLYYRDFVSNPVTIEEPATTAATVVVVNGTVLAPTTGFTVSGTNVTLVTPPPIGADVAVAVYADAAIDSTQMSIQTLAYNVGKNWTLNPYDAHTTPEIAGTIVEVNGLRLTPTVDYTVTTGALHISASLAPTDVIVATLFTHSSVLGTKLVTSPVSGNTYNFPAPWDEQYVMIWMGGHRLAPDIDYQMTINGTSATVNVASPSGAYIVIMTFTNPPASQTIQWMANSRQPASIRMRPARDATGAQLIGIAAYGATSVPLYQCDDEYVMMSPWTAGTLSQPLETDDTAIVIDLFLRDTATALLPAYPFSAKGAIWIGAERIEYLNYARTGDVVTLSQLRRGTRGTSITEQRHVQTATGTGLAQTIIMTGTGAVEVMVDGIPHAFTSSVMSGNTQVSVTATAGAHIIVVLTTGYTYAAGRTVYNGDLLMSAPVPITKSQALDSPVLSLDFIGSQTLDPRLSFTRASVGTYIDATGVVQTAAINAPRWGYDPTTHVLRGLLMEQSRTNLFLNSAVLATQSVTVTAVQHSLSFYGTGSIIYSGAASGTLVGTGVGNRVSTLFTATAGTLTCTVAGQVLNAQLEQQGLSSYIDSGGTAGVRSRDECSMPLGSWFDPVHTTLFAEYIVPVMPETGVLNHLACTIGDGTNANRYTLNVEPTGTGFASALTNIAGVGGGANTVNNNTAFAVMKFAASWDGTTSISVLNSGTPASFAVGTPPGLNTFFVGGQTFGNNNVMNGWIRRLMYWNRTLSVAELQAATT